MFAFGAYDYLGQKDSSGEHPLFDTTFHRLDLRYDHRFAGRKDSVRQAITLGWDETGVDKGAYALDEMLSARTELDTKPVVALRFIPRTRRCT